MNPSSSQYTAMYNTYKTYCLGKDIDKFYETDNTDNNINEKGKTENNFTRDSNNFNNSTKYSNNSEKFDQAKYNNTVNYSQNNLINSQNSDILKNTHMSKIIEDERENEETFNNDEPVFHDEYDEQYRNIICWNCKTAFAGGNTWEKVTCPNCKEVNDVPLDKNDKIKEWERFLEMKHIKVTCPQCKKNIYCTRESEYVTCSECHCIMTIVKDVPLRPGTYEHKFSASVVVPEKKDFVHHYDYSKYGGNLNDNSKKINNKGIFRKSDPFKDIYDVSKKNEYNIKKMLNK